MDNYLKSVDSDWYKARLTGAVLCVMAAFFVLMLRLFYLQILEGQEFRRLSENNCIRLQSIDAPRGLIYDRNGTLLVDNRPAFDLSIVLKDARPVKETLQRLATYLGRPYEAFAQRLEKARGVPSYKPILLLPDIGRDTLALVEVHKFDLPGIRVNVAPRRHYLFDCCAAHLLGYLGEINAGELQSGEYPGCRGGDFIGKFGVEKSYESFMRGTRGGRQVEVNASGQVVQVLKTVPARPGHNVYLTIDQPLQTKAEEMLDGRPGTVVAMEPDSGKILALASSPTFDQNDFVNGLSHQQWDDLISNPHRPMQNKAIQGEYPPASTYKIITALAGLEEGVVDVNSRFFCPGHYEYGDRTFRCWKKHGHGHMNVVSALAESCDVYFYQVGQKLGVDRLAWYAKACGLGSATGISLDHESSGLIPTAAWKKRRTGISWMGGETLSIAIGQGYNLATVLQMASLTAAVGNGGIRYKPTLLERIANAEGRTVEVDRPQVSGKLPVSAKTLALVKKGLWQVVNAPKGTAWGVRMEEVEMSGKTGTAQVFGKKAKDEREDDEIPDHLRAHAWFVAYAPAEHPRIAVAVLVEHGQHGSSAAAPVARELVATYLGGEAEVAVLAAGTMER